MIYDFNTFRLAMMEILIALRDEARWTPMQRVEIAAAVGRIEDAVAGRWAMSNKVILISAGLACPPLVPKVHKEFFVHVATEIVN